MSLAAIDIVGSFAQGKSKVISAQRLMNCYEAVNDSQPEKVSYISVPGTREVVTFTGANDQEVRASAVFQSKLYIVVGDTVYELDSALNKTNIGTIDTSGGYVSISANLTDLIIVDGAKGYTYDGTTFAEITNPTFLTIGSPTTVAYLDGRLIVNDADNNRYYISDQESTTSWNSDYGVLTTKATNIVAVAVLNRQLFLFGDTVTEIWYDAGTPDFPFERDNSISYDVGCEAPGSIALSEGNMAWLTRADDGTATVAFTNGGEYEEISTPDVELILQEYGDLSDARAYWVKINGHHWYIINFTQANATWVYDYTTSMETGKKIWFEMSMAGNNRFIGQTAIFYQNRHYLGAYNAPILYQMSSYYSTHAGTPITKWSVSKPFRLPTHERLAINMFELRLNAGAQTSIPDDDNIYRTRGGKNYTTPEKITYTTRDFYREEVTSSEENLKIYLQVSRDGGRTFGNMVAADLGGVGRYRQRTIWRRPRCGRKFCI